MRTDLRGVMCCAMLLSALLGCGGCLGAGTRRPTVAPVVFESAGANPVATTPARLVIARVGYPEQTYHRRDEAPAPPAILSLYDTPDDIAGGAIADLHGKLSGVRDIVVLQPDMAAGDPVLNPEDLRRAARRYDDDLVLAFSASIDRNSKHHFPIFSVLTLGFGPNVTSESDGRAQAVLLDAHSGYVYARLDAKTDTWQLANTWSSDEAEDQSQQRVERRLVADLIEQTKTQWPSVLAQMMRGAPPAEVHGAASAPAGTTYPTRID